MSIEIRRAVRPPHRAALAESFTRAGYAVLVYDHRGFGGSGGGVRPDVDSWRQIADRSEAISFLETVPEVDVERIGVSSTSYSGGHVIVLGATDRRIKAVVSQVPTISDYEAGLRRVPGEAVAAMEARFNEDERGKLAGMEPL